MEEGGPYQEVGKTPLAEKLSPPVPDNTVWVIDTSGLRSRRDGPDRGVPTSITVVSDGKTAYVSDRDAGTLTVLNADSRSTSQRRGPAGSR